MCFVWVSEQTAIISPYSINWLVFITKTECVYCAVRAASLYIIQVDISIFMGLNTVTVKLLGTKSSILGCDAV
jgi:hypothetical protein